VKLPRRPPPLGRQVAWVVSAIFFFALVGVQAIHLRSTHASLQRQLESLAQDAATSIGLSLGVLLRGGDAALAETVINPAFDRGHYEKIEYLAAGGERLVSRSLGLAQGGRYPAWFARLFALHAPTAESLVSGGWRQLGKVQVTVHPRFAYEQLWSTARDTLIYLLFIYAASLIALRIFLRDVLRPLAAVEGAAQAIAARNFVTLRLRPSTRELARVVEAMNSLSRKVNQAVQSETRRAERLQDAAYRDQVTGLLNARGFATRFEASYEGEHAPFAGVFAFVELSDLAVINRRLGAERCDALLREVCGAAQEAAATAGGFAGRWSGALTVLALPGMDVEAARLGLAALRREAAAVLKRLGQPRQDKVCCGGVLVSGGAAPMRHFAAAAEAALAQAREAPDGIAVLRAATPAMQAAKPATELVALVTEALAGRGVSLAGQVGYRLSDHRAMHTEIMARLREPSGRELAAAEFLPVVAAQGLSAQLDRAVIEKVAQGAAGGEGRLSVNVAIRSIESEGFTTWLEQLLRRDPALAARLTFEVSEQGVLQNEAAAAGFARALLAAGARFALDNFGIRRDSLALAQRLHPAYIKLAGAHTTSMASNSGARFYAESLVSAARQLDIPVIAQNVEDEAIFQVIAGLGFSGYQGNLGGRPSPWPPKAHAGS
jgi:EAL domain-containing protein (putative c-di-GMP-specific phosphodiesterase class I)/GGDEF domain-containing protein